MNADRIRPAPPPIRDKKRWRRLKTQVAKEIGCGESIRNCIGLVAGYAYPDGRFETYAADNFRYSRQMLHDLHRPDLALTAAKKRQIIATARYIRLDEIRYRAQGSRGTKAQQSQSVGLP